MHISRPLYEGLPWLYISLGLGGIAVSYFVVLPRGLAAITGVAGFAALLAGVVIMLRRRDFREFGRRYAGHEEEAPGRAERPKSGIDQD